MFGSTASQPTGGFNFGSNNTNNASTSNSTGGFQFGAKPNIFGNSQTTGQTTVNALNGVAQNGAPKPSGFSFGSNNTNTNSTPATNSQAPAFSLNSTPSAGLFSGNNAAPKPATSTGGLFSNSNTTSNMFGNNTNGQLGSNPTIGAGMFSSNNKLSAPVSGQSSNLFGNNMNNSLVNNGGIQQQQQQQPNNFSSSPYGLSYPPASSVEMPKALTPQRSTDVSQLKRKSSTGSSSHDSPNNSKVNSHTNTGNSFLNRIRNTFKLSTANKFPTDGISGIFSSSRPIVETKESSIGGSDPINAASSSSSSSSRQLTTSFGGLKRSSSSKFEYRRLVVRNPSSTFKNYKDINPDDVILKRRRIQPLNGSSTASISDFNPKKELRNEKEETEPKVLEITPTTTISTTTQNDGQTQTADELNSDKIEKNHGSYWCSPSISYLSTLSKTELSHVEDFVAGRLGYGQVSFQYPVDLTAFQDNWDQLLGGCILFRPKILQVYPDGFTKPCQGNGLNVPATVMVEGCFPIDKSTKKPIKDPSSPEMNTFIKKLKNINGMNFINYDFITGTFTFSVEHFSIWGLVDEDEDDPELVSKFKKQQEEELANEKRKNEIQVNALEKISNYQNGKLGRLLHKNNQFSVDDSFIYKKQKKNFESFIPGGFTYQNNSLDDELSSESELDDEFIQIDKPETGVQGIDSDSDHAENDDDDDDDDSIESNSSDEDEVDFNNLVVMKAYEPDIEDLDMTAIKTQSEFPVSEDWEDQIALSDGFYSVFNKDLNASKDMKLDFKQVNEFLFGQEDGSKFKMIETPIAEFGYMNEYKTLLDLEIKKANTGSRSSNQFPIVEFNSNIDIVTTLNVFKNTTDYKLWDLIGRLFDDNYCLSFLSGNDLSCCKDNELLQASFLKLKRRELIISWLQDYNSIEIERLLSINRTDPLEYIFILLCSGDLNKAIDYAIDTNNNHLSVLLTLIDSNDKPTKQLAKAQLIEWNKNSTLKLIPQGVLKIYKLLSGDILSTEFISHCNGLNWSIVLLLLLKYGDSNMSLSSSLQSFISYESKLDRQPSGDDLVYSIIRLVDGPTKILDKFEVQFQFLLLKYLNNSIKIDSTLSDSIVLKFSEKLNNYKLFEESIFVLEHLKDDLECKNQICKLLDLSIDSLGYIENDSRLLDVHNTLNIPLDKLHESRANKFEKSNEYYKMVNSLISANLLDRAHDVTLSKVAPEFIISNSKLDDLKELLSNFKTLSNWPIGGALYNDYLTILDITRVGIDDKLGSLEQLIKNLINGLRLLKNTNLKVKVAKTLMYKKLIQLIFENGFEYNAEQLLSLDLPSSEANYSKIRVSPTDLAIDI